MGDIYTIGHSNLTIDRFIVLLKQNEITRLIDIRSVPYSRFYPQFNKDRLAESLLLSNILYMFEGDCLGGRITDKDCYINKVLPQRKTNIAELVNYDILVQKDWFIKGINNIININADCNSAVMCSEEQPLRCHRNILVARRLIELGYKIKHIRGNGDLEDAYISPELEQLKMF